MAETGARSYLSGLLIGHEIRAASITPSADPIHLAGEPHLCRLYARALAAFGRVAIVEPGDAAILGLVRIGGLVKWT